MAVLDALGNPYRFAYDRRQMIRHTDRNGLSFYYEYDKTGETWRVVHAGRRRPLRLPLRVFAGTERNAHHRFARPRLAGQVRRARSAALRDHLARRTHVLRVRRGGITVGATDPGGRRTGYDYDERGNLLKLTRPDGKSIQTEFDTANKAVSIADPNGARWWQQWHARAGG